MCRSNLDIQLMGQARAPCHVSAKFWVSRRPPQDICKFEHHHFADSSPNTDNYRIFIREGETEDNFHIEKEKITIKNPKVYIRNVLKLPKKQQITIRDCKIVIKKIALQPKVVLKRCQYVSRGFVCQGKKVIKSTAQSAKEFQIIQIESCSSLSFVDAKKEKILPIPGISSTVPKSTKYKNIDVTKWNNLLDTNVTAADSIVKKKCPFCFTFHHKPAGSLGILQQHLFEVHGLQPFPSSVFDVELPTIYDMSKLKKEPIVIEKPGP